MFYIEHIARDKPFSMTSNHFHDGYEIFYLIKGERDYFIRDRTYRIGEGSIVLIDEYELHRTIDTGVATHERYLINFSKTYLGNAAPSFLFDAFTFEPRCIQLNHMERSDIEFLLEHMLREYTTPQPESILSIQSLLTQLLISVGRAIRKRDSIPDTDLLERVSQHDTVNNVAGFIRRHFHAPLTLSSVAREFYLSPAYLSKIFKAVTGFTFVDYVRHVRVVEAQRLLRETSLPVSEIATLSGFENIAHFGRVFKQLTSTTPLHYRKMQLP